MDSEIDGKCNHFNRVLPKVFSAIRGRVPQSTNEVFKRD